MVTSCSLESAANQSPHQVSHITVSYIYSPHSLLPCLIVDPDVGLSCWLSWSCSCWIVYFAVDRHWIVFITGDSRHVITSHQATAPPSREITSSPTEFIIVFTEFVFTIFVVNKYMCSHCFCFLSHSLSSQNYQTTHGSSRLHPTHG